MAISPLPQSFTAVQATEQQIAKGTCCMVHAQSDRQWSLPAAQIIHRELSMMVQRLLGRMERRRARVLFGGKGSQGMGLMPAS